MLPGSYLPGGLCTFIQLDQLQALHYGDPLTAQPWVLCHYHQPLEGAPLVTTGPPSPTPSKNLIILSNVS
jgi:hypothetical protein